MDTSWPWPDVRVTQGDPVYEVNGVGGDVLFLTSSNEAAN